MSPLELWGGIECTVNRVADKFYRQLDFSGHSRRSDDLRSIAQLGIKALRYPVLWEDVAPNGPSDANWSWVDERLQLLRELEVKPIVGLVHHGSGPLYTNLLDDNFAPGLAAYASTVAARYPWVEAYTPINEPLTTARFSALYGHWYPHARNDRKFVRALLNQCRGTVLAMQAIRRVNPNAQLIQTDDLGRVYSTSSLAYQAAFENERRWLAWDLLSGKVNKSHALWKYLRKLDVPVQELKWFSDNPCVPNIVGINHYVTSDRYLHQNKAWCPRDRWGGNKRHTYADTEAVRVLHTLSPGIGALLKEASQRYQVPLAITEVHLGCTREEQLRWLYEIWQAAHTARDSGVDVCAVTVWALLGSFDWNSLLTTFSGHYEPGAFDVRSPIPRPTALAHLAKQLASNTTPSHHELLTTPGWWRRPTRLLAGCQTKDIIHVNPKTRPILITGATGTLGRAFAVTCERRGIHFQLCTRADLDIGDRASIDRALVQIKPWAVINAAGYVRVDDAEKDSERCYRENSHGPQELAKICADQNLPLLTFSSDLVFDGNRSQPYLESHATHPLNVYGRSKAQAEASVLETYTGALVIRTSAFFGPWDKFNFLTLMLNALTKGECFTAIDDIVVSPTYVPDLTNVSLDLLIDGERGLWHLANQGAVSWMELARLAAQIAKVSTKRLMAKSWRSLGLMAERPTYTALGSERGLLLPPLTSAVERYASATAYASWRQ